jgi:three-Cys-motif partner protein
MDRGRRIAADEIFGLAGRQARGRGSLEQPYIDLFCGPGRYEDGTESTPIQILRSAANHPDLCNMLVTMFNDKDEENVQRLQQTIEAMPEVGRLNHKPDIYNHEVGNPNSERIREVKPSTYIFPLFG